LADNISHLASAKALTRVNNLFTQRDLPQWKTYRWRADDGKSIEAVLLYPPGKLNASYLRMLTLIHGGPADADGNHFGADWYNWASLAAANGWLVFEPNYRGSSGYGDDFMTEISAHIVSRPGKDIPGRNSLAEPAIYQQEAALFQFDKVRTPVHDVIGSDDIRVSASQGYLLERALDTLGIPHTLLVSPERVTD